MWIFDRRNSLVSKDGIPIDLDTYSGTWPLGYNDPTLQGQIDVGPIPAGFWKISGPPFDDTEHGKYILRLEPEPGTETYGRVGFLWHGKPLLPVGIAPMMPCPLICCGSKGCMCSAYLTRMRAYQSGDTKLQVI